MTRLSAFIEGVGLLGPGLNQWPHAAALLTGQAPYAPERTALPPPAGLPAAERRLRRIQVEAGADAEIPAVRLALHV
ncbi:hypothetical protein ACQUWR_24945, partial [Ralstonia pseudosolanacearum]